MRWKWDSELGLERYGEDIIDKELKNSDFENLED